MPDLLPGCSVIQCSWWGLSDQGRLIPACKPKYIYATRPVVLLWSSVPESRRNTRRQYVCRNLVKESSRCGCATRGWGEDTYRQCSRQASHGDMCWQHHKQARNVGIATWAEEATRLGIEP